MAAYETFDANALTLGFARRFATYKRAPLIFHDAKRLAALLNSADHPVQIVFAGKAHPRDAEGQAFAARIYKQARRAGYHGRVALLENYDMEVGRLLTSGCDVWLNNPVRPQEASGTSGMKPPLHGGLNCLDSRRLVARGVQPPKWLGTVPTPTASAAARHRTATMQPHCTRRWQTRLCHCSTTATARAYHGVG